MIRFYLMTSRTLTGLLLLLALAGCQPPNKYEPPPPPPVLVMKPIQQDVQRYLDATGTTEAVETVEIRARVQGFLKEIQFQPGDDVKKDQQLFLIEPEPLMAVQKQAEASVAVAEAEHEDAKAKFERAEPLAKTGAVSAEELNEKRAAMLVAASQIVAAKANLEAATLDVGYTKVFTPIDGRVGKHEIDAGNLVGGVMPTHLTTVVKYNPIYVNFSIGETEVQRIIRNAPKQDEGETVPVELSLSDEEDFPHKGKLNFVDLGVESDTGTLMLRGVFPNAKTKADNYLIMPGAFVKVRIPMGQPKPSVLVPDRAIGYDQAGRYVFVIVEKDVDGTKQWIVERRNIEVGDVVGENRVVIGLEPTENVIIEGLQRARPTKPVNPTFKEDSQDSTAAKGGNDASKEKAADKAAGKSAPEGDDKADDKKK